MKTFKYYLKETWVIWVYTLLTMVTAMAIAMIGDDLLWLELILFALNLGLYGLVVFMMVYKSGETAAKLRHSNDIKRRVIMETGDYYDFNIEKRDSLTLDLVLNENLYNDSLVVAVEVGNQFERKTIDVAFAPSGKYQIDSVSYQWNAFIVADSASRYSHAYILDNTQSSKPTTQWIHPYSNYSAQRKVNFYSDGYWNFDLFERYFGTPLPRIRIPDLVGGQLNLGKTEVEFGIQSHQLESGLDTNVKEEITVNAGEHRRTEIYYIREIYNGPYRVYASNPSTGKKQVFSGEISSERIIGYKIISYNIKEDENRQENN